MWEAVADIRGQLERKDEITVGAQDLWMAEASGIRGVKVKKQGCKMDSRRIGGTSMAGESMAGHLMEGLVQCHWRSSRID